MAKTAQDLIAFDREYIECEGFRIQNLNEHELSTLEAHWMKRYETTDSVDLAMRRELIVLCLVDDQGERLFGSGDADQLKGSDPRLIKKLHAACRTHVGLSEAHDPVGKPEDTDTTED